MAAGRKNAAQYIGLLAVALAAGIALTWFLGAQLDHYAYDFMFRLYKPKLAAPQSVLLAIDEKTLRSCGGLRGNPGIRKPLADALRLTAAAKSVAVDLIFADKGPDPAVNAALADAFHLTPNLILAAQLTAHEWEEPIPEFAKWAAAIGHVHAQPDADSVTRAIPLEKHFGKTRRWALALEAFRLSRGDETTTEYPDKLEVGGIEAPIGGKDGRLMRVRFLPPGSAAIPRISMAGLLAHPELSSQFAGKVVFVGVTALSEVSDRLSTPYSFGSQTTGIEINAEAFETLAHQTFITDVKELWVVLFCAGITLLIGLAFRFLPGWLAYAGSGLVATAAVATPYIFFTHSRVFSFAMPASVAWFTFIAAAGYYHLVVRRSWKTEQAARARYQQAMHFVTHEMRTPLSAIQGSSELISRYALTEEKRKQIALLINSESKRLARMVEVFLNVERLSAGQMQMKRELIPAGEMVALCMERVRPLAERKRIGLVLHPIGDDMRIEGDRELMEYACYNLLTNAVKYSPQQTEVNVSGSIEGGQVRIAVKDQGIGMDQKEVKQIFQKFYRTRKAEESGEAGTGIGLSIVQQIVEQHGGRIEVLSQPGAGSCFTLVVPAADMTGAAGGN
jgi:signal transduction histidine kinase